MRGLSRSHNVTGSFSHVANPIAALNLNSARSILPLWKPTRVLLEANWPSAALPTAIKKASIWKIGLSERRLGYIHGTNMSTIGLSTSIKIFFVLVEA